MSICVLSGDWRFPDEGKRQQGNGKAGSSKGKEPAEGGGGGSREGGGTKLGEISEPVRDVVRRCLKVEPGERPDVDELIEMVEDVVAQLPEDEAVLED